MAITWIDVTIPLHAGMVVWPGDPPFEASLVRSMGNGDGCNITGMSISTHTGTHLDAPWHVHDDWPRLDEIDPGLFFGPATVFELSGVDVVTAEDLGGARLPARLLIKTRNSLVSSDAPFRKDFVAITSEAARRIVDERVRLLGVDGPSVGRYGQDGRETHEILLGNHIPVVEGLRLGMVPPGLCEFVVLPLHIPRADGAPCRAFAGLEEQP